MKTQTFLALAVCLCGVALAVPADNRYGSFDIDVHLANDRTLKNVIKCLLDTGPCTAQANHFKRAIPGLLETACGTCGPVERFILRRLLNFVKRKKPQEWEKLIKKYDPEGKYHDVIENFINATDRK